jgi:hypothetical protein
MVRRPKERKNAGVAVVITQHMTRFADMGINRLTLLVKW